MENGNAVNLPNIKMNVASLLDHYRRCGIHLYAKNGELGYRTAKGAMTEEIMSTIRTRKSDILHHLAYLEESRFHVTATSANRALLFNRFLWKYYSNRVMEVSSANAPHIVMRCTGEILTEPLLRSIDILLERHEVLSSSIDIDGGNLYLVYHSEKSVAFREVTVTVAGKTTQEREDEAHHIANNLVWEEYDLDKGPLYRVFLIRLSAVDYILGVALHHAIGDLISIGILLQELFHVYGSIMNGTMLRVTPTRIRYVDYLASMESWSTRPSCIKHIQYWKDLLKSTPVTDLLPKGNRFQRGTVSESTAEMKLRLTARTSRGLKEMAVRLKTTLFTVLLAIYKTAIWRMNGQEELVVVALHAGRFNAGFQNIIGDFALEVAYKTCLAGNPSFTEVVGCVVRAMNEANLHQPVPLDWVRSALAEDDILFSAPGINFTTGDAYEPRNPLGPRQLSLPPPGVRHGCHGFPVSCAIEFRDGARKIEGSMVYRKDLYDKAAIGAFLNCFTKTASDAIRFPERKLDAVGRFQEKRR